MRELTGVLGRESSCIGCGASIQQTGVRIGENVSWSPVRCPVCAEKRSAELEADRAREQQDDRVGVTLQRIRKAEKAVEDLNVPPLYRGVTLDTFELHGSPSDHEVQARAVRKGRQYLGTWPEVSQHMLILRGDPGTGKGHWAWSVASTIASVHGARVRVVKLADMVRRLRASWGQEERESETAALSFYRDLDLLVIDEVSRHAFYGQNIHQHLYDVLDHRIEYCRPTILTSNETDEGLEAILRFALLDRIQGHGGILEFGTASYRARPKTL